jgi:hypothetical protein
MAAKKKYLVVPTESVKPKKIAVKNYRRPKKKPLVGYSFDIALEICEGIASGQSLKTITEGRKDMPTVGTILRWVTCGNYPEFVEMYNAARDCQADYGFERILQITDNLEKGLIRGSEARVAVDSLKWLMGKIKPEKYSEKIQVESDTKFTIEVVKYAVDAEVQKQITQMISGGNDGDGEGGEDEDVIDAEIDDWENF